MVRNPRVLAPDDPRRFREQGFLLPPEPVLAEATFKRLTDVFEEDLERWGEDNLDVVHARDPRLFEFLLDDNVLDMVEDLLGPDIGLWSSHFISKPARTGRATPWHEDSAYWAGRISTMENVVTVWLAIDAATRENGCMKVIPGSHLGGGQSQYIAADPGANIFPSEIDPDSVDEGQAVYFELQPNHCSLHEARIMHAADANVSSTRRCGYTMRYFPLTSLVLPELNVGHRVWRARGKDRAGNVLEEV